jgi:hypothetical protein
VAAACCGLRAQQLGFGEELLLFTIAFQKLGSIFLADVASSQGSKINQFFSSNFYKYKKKGKAESY